MKNTPKMIGTPAFLALPASAQALYFHLDARAGESGYLTNSTEVAKLIEAVGTDLQALHAGRFVFPLEGGLLIVRLPQLREYFLRTEFGAIPMIKAKPNKDPKAVRHKHGAHGWIMLTEAEYTRLLTEFGERELNELIDCVDEKVQLNRNKNKYEDWNLVLRKARREGWHRGHKSQPITPAAPQPQMFRAPASYGGPR